MGYTKSIEELINKNEIKTGIANVYIQGATAAIMMTLI